MTSRGAHHRFDVSLYGPDRRHSRKHYYLPPGARHAGLSTTDGMFVRISVAKTPKEIESAYSLVRRRYAWRGYDTEAAAQPCLSATQSRSDQETTFIAVSHERIIGTVTLGIDGALGLRAEETHGSVIDVRRAAGRRVCELTRLAVAERVDSKSVLASLFSLVHAAGTAIHDITDVFIEVNPRHVVYYVRVLGFVVAAREKLCERVRAPSVLLHVEIETLSRCLDALIDRVAPQTVLANAA